MDIKDWRSKALGSFLEKPLTELSQYKEKRLAVDVSIWLNRYSCTDMDKLAMTSEPPYPASDLLQHIKSIHCELSKIVTLVYVSDGVPPNVEDGTKDDRCQEQLKRGSDWTSAVDCARQSQDFVISDDDLKNHYFADGNEILYTLRPCQRPHLVEERRRRVLWFSV